MGVPVSLRDPLLKEYDAIIGAYLEGRWTPTELSGGRFCEIVYTILDGHASGNYPTGPIKPGNFVGACRALEKNTVVPRSFQILISRLLPALYEIRNNRGVGHVGGDVDSNPMDAAIVVASVRWVMGELIRVFHSVAVSEAQQIVNELADVVLPLVWTDGQKRRILTPTLSVKDKLILLLASSGHKATFKDLAAWTEEKNQGYLKRTIRALHKEALVDFDEKLGLVVLLPPGSLYASNIVKN
jgi:hypothetical protein